MHTPLLLFTALLFTQEANRQGSLQVDRATALGLQSGWQFSAIKDGHEVEVRGGIGQEISSNYADLCVNLNSLLRHERCRIFSWLANFTSCLNEHILTDVLLQFCVCTLQNKDGLIVTTDMCVTAARPGRKLVIMGSSSVAPSPTSAFVRLAKSADVLLSGAVAPPGQGVVKSSPALSNGRQGPCGLSASEYGRLAAQVGADKLLLARLDMRCGE